MPTADRLPGFTVELTDLERCLDEPVRLFADVFAEASVVEDGARGARRVVLAVSSPSFEATASTMTTKRFVPKPPRTHELRRTLRIDYGDGRVAVVSRNGPRPTIRWREVVVEGPDLRWTTVGRFFGTSTVDRSGREVLRSRLERCEVASLDSEDHLALMALLLLMKIPQSISLLHTDASP